MFDYKKEFDLDELVLAKPDPAEEPADDDDDTTG